MNRNTSDLKQFPALRLVMRLYKIVAVLVAVVYAFLVVAALLDSGLVAAIVLAIAGFFVFVFIYASGELIEVFLSVEENSRTLVEIQKRALQIQMRNTKE